MPTQGIENYKNVGYAEYDFSKDGGAIGDIELRGDVLPEGAIVTNSTIHVNQALTSGGSATIAVKLQTAADVRAATAVASYSLNAILAGIQDGAASHMLRLTANRRPTITIAAAALTGGKMTIAFEYLMTS